MSLFAVIKTGGKQYIVKKDDLLKIEKIAGDSGKTIKLDQILLLFDPVKKEVEIGRPIIKDAYLEVEIIRQDKGKKIFAVKYKPKSRYHKKTGHRQLFTEIKVNKIERTTKASKISKTEKLEKK